MRGCLISLANTIHLFRLNPWLLELDSSIQSFLLYCFPLLLCIVHLKCLLISPCILWNSEFSWVYLSLSPCFSSLLSSAIVKPSQRSIFPYAFLFLGAGFGHHILYSVMNIHPQFFRHSLYLVQYLESSYYLHFIITRDLTQAMPEWPSVFPYFCQFNPGFFNKELMTCAKINFRFCFS